MRPDCAVSAASLNETLATLLGAGNWKWSNYSVFIMEILLRVPARTMITCPTTLPRHKPRFYHPTSWGIRTPTCSNAWRAMTSYLLQRHHACDDLRPMLRRHETVPLDVSKLEQPVPRIHPRRRAKILLLLLFLPTTARRQPDPPGGRDCQGVVVAGNIHWGGKKSCGKIVVPVCVQLHVDD